MTDAELPHDLKPAGLSLANWQDPPFNRWSFLHVGQLLPTRPVTRNGAATTHFTRVARPILRIPTGSLSGEDVVTVADTVAATETDAFLVLHDGGLVHESYAPSMSAGQPHLLMSVTKSFIGAVAGILADGGELDLDRPISEHLPEVVGHGYDGATTRHLLDMRSGIAFSEEYLDPEAEVSILERAASWRPVRPGDPSGIYGYLAQLPADGPHGGPFRYRSGETDILGWVCERASGTDMPTLLSTLIWQRLGMEQDAHMLIDATGAAVHDGGLSATARDLARFGQLLLDDGRSLLGEQVLPPGWTTDTVTGAPDSALAFQPESIKSGMPRGHYRNQLWVPVSGRPLLLALGIYGQMVYVNPAVRMVGVKLSSWPTPQDPVRFSSTFAAFEAIAAELGSSTATTAAPAPDPAQPRSPDR